MVLAMKGLNLHQWGAESVTIIKRDTKKLGFLKTKLKIILTFTMQ